MSHNQSRADTRESSSYRRTGRSGSFNQHRGGARGSGGGGGGGSAAPPPVSSTFNPSLNVNRSFNKKYNNAQGGQPRVSGAGPGGGIGADSHQNGAHQQQPLRGASDVSVASAHAPLPNAATVKSTDASTQKVTRAVPRAPTSNVVAPASELTAPVTPAKNPGDASRSFPLQFGSISPGVMNVLQIPARTSSAPPNLDEQKKAQARSDTSRAIPSLPNPSTSEQPMPRKDTGSLDQSNPSEAHEVTSKPKRDVQISAPPPVTQTQKPSTHSMPGMHMQIPFHQPFGGPGPQIPSHSMSATSLPMPMHLPIGNLPMQQPMYVPSLQPHPIQSQGMMHQGQGLNFSSGMGPQLPQQLGNMGMNMPSQFSPQQAGKFVGQRKVKITHPDTHEELRLDGTPGLRSHPNMPPQSQPIAPFPPGHPNYYPNSYNSSSVFFQAPNSLPLGTQSSQPQRLFNQVTVKPAAGGIHPGKEKLPSVSSAAIGKDPMRLSKPHGGDSAHSQKDTDTVQQSSTTQSKTGDGSKSASRPVENIQSTKGADSISGKSPAAGILSLNTQATIESSTSLIKGSVEAACETLGGLDSTEDQPKKQVTRGQLTLQDKTLGKSTSVSSQPSQYPLTRPIELNSAASVSTTVNAKESLSPSESTELKSHITGNFVKKDSSEPLDSRNQEAGKPVVETGDRNEVALPEVGKQDNNNSSKPSSESLSVESAEVSGLTEAVSPKRATNVNIENGPPEIGVEDVKESVACSTGVDNMADRITSSASNHDSTNTEACMSATGLSAQDYQESDIADPEEALVTKSSVASQEFASDLVKYSGEDENAETNNTGLVSKSSSDVKEKSLVDSNVPKVTVARGKEKLKDLYKKADATSATSDLYMAYIGSEKKDELTQSIETIELTSSDNPEPLSADVHQEDLRSAKKVGEVKAEPADWEDAADVSTPELEAALEHGKKLDGEDGDGATTKTYTRDFLLKFAEQCIDIPEGFNVAPDIAAILMHANATVSREPLPSPGRGIDRPSSGHRERRGSGIGDGDKWSMTSVPLMPGRDLQPDLAYGANAMGFRHGQGGNYGVLRHPQAPMLMQFGVPQYTGGILSGPMQSMGPHGGGLRNGVDADRWQRGTAFQKGLMPSSPTPAQIMHKAEIKYEVGKVTDEEQAKQRQLKAILNKLTPQNFEKLFQQVKEVNVDNVVTLKGVISQIFDKALMEPTFCEMYANFCQHLAVELPDLSVDEEKITFKRLLLNKCQEEFERGEREEQEANVTNEEGEVKLSAEEREEKRVKVRRRMLGNIRLIGELYKKRMLTERIMHECINKLLGDYQNPDEENVEALCKLMSTIGEMIDHAKAKEYMDAYFDWMENLSNNMKLSSRVRFMLKDSIDLRKNKWQQRRKVEGPKKIEEVHRDAAQERHAQATRLARTPSTGVSSRRGQPMDFSPRGSMLSSSGPQMGGFRPMSQVRGYGLQDVRVDERHSFENRTLSLPLTKRPLGDDPITLGPQGGLAKGMSSRGQPAGPSISFTDNVPSFGDSRRMSHAQNGYGSFPERAPYGLREELTPKYMPERLSSQHDQASAPDRNVTCGSKDRVFDSARPASPLVRSGWPTSPINVAPDKIWSEERLRDMSMAAIKEFYSAKDEKEVALCLKDLNSPSFYPSMISLWVTDSFERKDMERDLLAKLIIDLTMSRDVALSHDQLIQGFENVLTSLEDAVNDAPRAAEFLGRLFGKVIIDNVVPFNEIGHLIYKGGEEEGRLVEIGLAAEVLGSTLEMIKLEQGDLVVSELCRSSSMQLENFRPRVSKKQWKLDKFI